jgi:hypothetical protein
MKAKTPLVTRNCTADQTPDIANRCQNLFAHSSNGHPSKFSSASRFTRGISWSHLFSSPLFKRSAPSGKLTSGYSQFSEFAELSLWDWGQKNRWKSHSGYNNNWCNCISYDTLACRMGISTIQETNACNLIYIYICTMLYKGWLKNHLPNFKTPFWETLVKLHMHAYEI